MTAKLIRFRRDAPTPAALGAAAPAGATRLTLATPLDLPGLPPAPFAAVEVVWLDGIGGPGPGPGGVVEVLVEEEVRRGGDALAARWADGGARLKVMQAGRRNPALSRAAFRDRWRSEAGRLGGEAIPDDLRGLAYVQDHPVDEDPPVDAVNEVWFDDPDALARRVAWFAARPVPTDLMAPERCWTLCLREVVVLDRTGVS